MSRSTTLVEKAYDAHRGLFLSVSEFNISLKIELAAMGSSINQEMLLSPYFQTIDLRRVGTDRNTHLFLDYMDILVADFYVVSGVPEIVIALYDSTSGVFQSFQVLAMTWSDVKTNGLGATALATINSYAAGNSFTVGTVQWFGGNAPSGLTGAPAAAITDCPADATTNYNVVTTLLGSVTGAVNTANTKQNAIAVQLNSLLAELRTLGIIHA